jgi:hypothetical protein
MPLNSRRHLRYARYARFGGSLRSPHHTLAPPHARPTTVDCCASAVSDASRVSGLYFHGGQRAVTEASGHERIYGEALARGDIVGVRFDADVGALSLWVDGVRYGEHTVVDHGPAFDQVDCRGDSRLARSSPRAARGARRVFYPAVAFSAERDAVSFTGRYVSLPGAGEAGSAAAAAAAADTTAAALAGWRGPCWAGGGGREWMGVSEAAWGAGNFTELASI